MKKSGLCILVIMFVTVFSGCVILSKQLLDKSNQALMQVAEIKELIENEEFDKAFEQCKAVINNRFISEDDWNLIAVEFQNQDRYEEGLYILNTLILRNGRNDSTLNNLSWAYHMIYRNELANFFADRALAILPNTEYEYCNKANALRGLGQPEEAIKYYDLALKVSPDFPHAIWGKAMAYDDMEDYAKSLEFFMKYREIMPDDEESTRYHIASCYLSLNQPMDAIREYENFYNKDTTDTSYLYSIASVYYQQEDYQKALEYYDKILSIEPDEAWAYFSKADCYARMDRLDESIQAIRKAIDIEPDYIYEIIYMEEAEKIRNHKDFKTLFE